MTVRPFPRSLTMLFVVVLVMVVCAGVLFFMAERDHQRAMAEDELMLIAETKTAQIAEWREELLADAALLSSNPLIGEEVAAWLKSATPSGAASLQSILDSVIRHQHYDGALLFDADVNLRLQSGSVIADVQPEVLGIVAAAIRDAQVILTDLHLDVHGGNPHLGVVAPVFDPAAPDEAIAAIVLQTDAEVFLYPLVQSWPAPSESAETLLVRRDGDDVLFLNDLRHQEGAALTLRIPLTEVEVPAVMAVSGVEGVVQGQDYRGVEVISFLSAIPDSNWFMVAKIDRSEALAGWQSTSLLIVVLVLALLLAIVAVFGFLWQRQERVHIGSLLATHRELEESERAMSVLLANLPGAAYRCRDDAVWTTEFISEGCRDLTGYSPSQLTADGVVTYGALIHPDDRQLVWDTVQRAVAAREVFEHTYRIATATGEEKWVWERGRGVFDADGTLLHLEGILSDVTEEVTARQDLKRTSEELEQFFSLSLDLLCIADVAGYYRRVNKQFETVLGYAVEEIEGAPFIDFVHPDDVEATRRVNADLAEGKSAIGFVNRCRRKDGSYRWLEWRCAPAGGLVYAAARDITERREFEERLRESEHKFRSLFEQSRDAISINALDGSAIDANQAWADMLGYTLDEVKSLHANDIYAVTGARAEFLADIERDGFVSDVSRFRRKDGTVIVCQRSVVPRRDSEGKIVAFQGVYRDITEQLERERALRESEVRFRATFEQAAVGVAMVAPNGRWLRVNERLCAIVGYSRDELLTKTFQDITYTDDLDTDLGYVRQLLDGALPTYSMEKRYIRKDGSTVWVNLTVSMVRTATGDPDYFISVVEDISDRREIEAALRQSEQRFRLLVESSPDAIFVQTEGQFAYLNKAAVRLFGANSPDALLGAPVMERFHPDFRDHVRERIRLLNEDKQDVPPLEEKYLKLDGTEVPVEVKAVPIHYEGKDGALVFVRDITERIRTTTALRESEEFVRTILDSLPLGVAVNSIDPEVAFSYMNDNFLRTYHVQRDRIAAPDSFWEAVYDDPEFRERLRRRVLDDCASGAVERMQWDDVPLTREGKEIARISARNVPVPGKPLMISMVWDVTERNRSTRQLARHALRTETLLELHLMGGVEPDRLLDFALDAALRMTESAYCWLGLMNEAESEMTIHRWSGTAMEQCALETGPRVFSIHGGGLWSECVKTRRPVVVNDYAAPVHGKKGIPSGHVPMRRFLAVPVFDGDSVVSVVAVANKQADYDEFDVDALKSLGNQLWEMRQRRRSEDDLRRLNAVLEDRVAERTLQLEASNKELEAFAYSVSHDLRAPLRAIEGFSRILLEDHRAQLDDEGRRLLNVVRSNTARMDQLITDLLELSRVSQSALRSARMDMASAVASVCADVLPPEMRGSYELVIGDVPEVNGDLTLLKRVWFNLLSNAVKFTSRAEVRRIEVGGFGDGSFITYYVRDTGVGFDQRYVHKLFGVFQRLHSREEFEGTGIGLAIVQRIVHRHGGRVWAEGEPGKGAAFYFSLPKGDGDGEQQGRG